RDLPLLLTASFAMIWIIARACAQAVTLDEADAYLGFAVTRWPSHWYATSGNHVLNSSLQRLFVWLFGISHLTVRGPVLFGASICAGLSFCANFSFAYVNSAALLMFLLWAIWQNWHTSSRFEDRHSRVRVTARLLAACILPGLLVVIVICGSVLLDWPKGHLT